MTKKTNGLGGVQPASNSDSYTFRVSFSGLCAFVPRVDSSHSLKRMDVILVADDDDEAYAEIHRPVVGIYVKNLRGAADNGDLGETMAFFELNREQVEFFRVPKGKGLDSAESLEGPMTYREGGNSKDRPLVDTMILDENSRQQEFNDQQSDFCWLPRMKQIISAASEVEPSLVQAEEPPNIVKARVIVPCGELGSHDLGRYNGGFVVAQFTPAVNPGPPVRQAIAHWAGAEIQVDTKYDILVRISKIGDPENRKEVILKLHDNLALVVKVSNLCCGYYGSDTVTGLKGLRNLEPDDDFARFYDLLSKEHQRDLEKFPRLPMPIPVDYPALPMGEGGGVDPVRCSGVRFEPVPLVEV